MRKDQRDDLKIELLSERIEMMRDELLNIGLRDGLTASTTIKHSELLDEQIEIFQRVIKEY